jgi:hypothetical protein
VSVCPRICARQQYRLMPSSSRASFWDLPSSTSFLYLGYRCAIGLPQLKHLIGIIIIE